MQIKRPLLVGGLGLSFGLWAWEVVQQPFTTGEGGFLWGAIALGSGWWVWRQWRSPASLTPNATPWQPVTTAELDAVWAQIEQRMASLATELTAQPTRDPAQDASIVAHWQTQVAALQTPSVATAPLQIGVMGQPQTGKTTLAHVLSQQDWPSLVGRSLVWTEISVGAVGAATAESDSFAAVTAGHQDLVLFLVQGDLLASEQAVIQTLIHQRQRVLVVLNKQDHYSAAERELILERVRTRLAACLAASDVVAIAAQPRPIQRRQHQADGTVVESRLQPAADITAAIAAVQAIVPATAPALIQATTWRQAQALSRAIQQQINTYRRERALPVIEQYQWLAGAAAFANPVPSLDMVATAAISGQLVMELGAIYQQPFTTAQAKELATTLAHQMMQLGLVELSTQALSVALKGSAMTFVAGGALQGLSAAYLTRLAGLSLVEFLADQALAADGPPALPSLEQVNRILQQTVQRFRQGDGLKVLVQQGLKLLPTATAVTPPTSVA